MKEVIQLLEAQRVTLQAQVDVLADAIEALWSLTIPPCDVPQPADDQPVGRRRTDWKPIAKAAVLKHFPGRTFRAADAHPVIAAATNHPIARTTARTLLYGMVNAGELDRQSAGVFALAGAPPVVGMLDGWKMPRCPHCPKCRSHDTEPIAQWDTDARVWLYVWNCLGCHARLYEPDIPEPFASAFTPTAKQLRKLGFGVILS